MGAGTTRRHLQGRYEPGLVPQSGLGSPNLARSDLLHHLLVICLWLRALGAWAPTALRPHPGLPASHTLQTLSQGVRAPASCLPATRFSEPSACLLTAHSGPRTHSGGSCGGHSVVHFWALRDLPGLGVSTGSMACQGGQGPALLLAPDTLLTPHSLPSETLPHLMFP